MDEFLGNVTVQAMMINFSTIYGVLFGTSLLLVRRPEAKSLGMTNAMTCDYGPKDALESLWLKWAVCWVCCFGVIVGCGLYKWFGTWHYMLVCGGLAAPLLLQPLVWPQGSGEQDVPFLRRHCVKANTWIAIFSFIGNWWYTHYFYSVLKASYSMPAHDVNAVPIAMFFATHFYFSLYHVLASKVLRWVHACFMPGAGRFLFLVCLVGCMAYSTAFTESATISAYPCYQFADVHQAYTVGSAFYGIYFIVSYPLYFTLDEPPPLASSTSSSATPAIDGQSKAAVNDDDGTPATRTRSSLAKATSSKSCDQAVVVDGAAVGESSQGDNGASSSSSSSSFTPHSLKSCVLEALAAGMLVLMLLDFVRVWLRIELSVPLGRPCKSNPALTCKPFDGTTC